MTEEIASAIEAGKQGGIIIYPTDTAFGIGCRIDMPQSVDRLFALRNRPATQPMPVLVSSADQALAYLDHPSDIVRRFMQTYWPGALTIVANCLQDRIYSPIRGGGPTIGVRMPDHPAALEIIRGIGVPILGPSANFHGKPTPFRFEDLDKDLVRAVDAVVSGKTKGTVASTVVDCTADPYRIIRQGAVVLP